jgi:PhzF family phenazine biosynthesis protein
VIELSLLSFLLSASVYSYVHLDVFTDVPLTGNQLAVFLEPGSLTADEMMAITREMAFSETTFVFPPEVEGTSFRVRIFANNLGREIEVAGHPTIGTAFALARAGLIPPGTERTLFQLSIGPTPLELTWRGDELEFAWMAQRPPEFSAAIEAIEDRAAVARALGVGPEDLAAAELPVQQVSCGAPFLMVPFASREAVDRAQMDRAAMGEILDRHGLVRRGVMLFSTEPGEDGATVYSRMFGFGVVEDPATGNASGPLGSYLVRYGVVRGESPHHIVSRQGVKMRRPSRVHVRVATEGDAITEVSVGGSSAIVGEGTVQVLDHRPERPPNVVLIFADDVGYGDLGTYGHPTIRTPNLDRMAAEGQKWTNFYSASSVCSPSRAALLTGRLPVRSGLYGTEARTRVAFPDTPAGIPPEELTLAEVLSERGYATAVIGKWHLGHLPQYLPGEHGFDSWFGLPYSNDMDLTVPYSMEVFRSPRSETWNVPLMRNGTIVERPAEQKSLTKRYTDEAVRFIEENRDRPFFLYLPHSMAHVPLFRSEEFAGRSAAGLYGDVIEEIDASVGRVLDRLHELDLAGQTLVVFTSDNGPWLLHETQGGSAGLLHQGKGTTWEGGMRVPALFYWPGEIEPRTVLDLGTTMDLFATAASLAGARLPADLAIDGLDLTEALVDAGKSPRTVVPYYRFDQLYAIRKGWFKAHFVTQGEYGMGPERTVHNPPLLYHLGEDPGERFDVAGAHPDVVRELISEADTLRASVTVRPSLFDSRP